MSIPPQEAIRFLRGLRAVRDYTSETIDENVLEDILEVGRWAGSASNRQPTEVIVVRHDGTRQKLAENGAGPAANAAVALVLVTAGDVERHDLELLDEGRLVERLLLAARAYGLGSNIAVLKGDGPDVIKSLLGVPDDRRVWCVVTIGHIDTAARKARPPRPGPARKPAESFAHWDRY